MRTALFDFDLPSDRIASRPVAPRDAARLLVVRPDGTPELEDRGVGDLPDLLRRGDALVVNDTKVIAARLRGRRIGRGAMEPAIEATLHQRLDGSRWRAFVKPAKRLSPGDVVRFGDEGKVCFLGQLDATPVFFARVYCPICRSEHEWFAKEAWVCEAEPRPRRGALL